MDFMNLALGLLAISITPGTQGRVLLDQVPETRTRCS